MSAKRIVIVDESNYVVEVGKLRLLMRVGDDDTFHVCVKGGFGAFWAIFKYDAIGRR